MIARDPALVGSLLKLANSPLYRRGSKPVESVDRALAVLGTNGTRSLVAAALMQPVFRAADGDSARFAEIIWEHTQRSAAAAELHAAAVESSDPFTAQLVALVMGLGAIVVYRRVLDQYASAKHATRADGGGVAARGANAEGRAANRRELGAVGPRARGARRAAVRAHRAAGHVARPIAAIRAIDRRVERAAQPRPHRRRGRPRDARGSRRRRRAFERLWGRLTWPPELEGELVSRQS